MRNKIAVIAAAIVLILGSASGARAADKTADQLVKEARVGLHEVSTGDVKKMIDSGEKVIILDVRDRNELEDGRIPGAMNISRGMLEFKAATMLPDRSARIIVYCGLDLRSPLAAKTLHELGYVNVVNMAGGFKAWKAAGYAVEK